MNEFEQKRAERAERFRSMAEGLRLKSSQAYESSKTLLAVIPMGQPILVGHHSERGHRSLLKRADNAMRRSCQADDKAKYYERRAESIENSRAIFTDDPDAVTKLREKLEREEKRHHIMVSCNKIIRGKGTDAEKVAAMVSAGLAEKSAIEVLKPDFCGRIGFAGYSLQNSNGRIAALKKRIAAIEERAQVVEAVGPEVEEEYKGVRIVTNLEANRVQLFFNGKPSDEVRGALKRGGYRWSPSNGCWQSYINGWAVSRGKEAIDKL